MSVNWIPKVNDNAIWTLSVRPEYNDVTTEAIHLRGLMEIELFKTIDLDG